MTLGRSSGAKRHVVFTMDCLRSSFYETAHAHKVEERNSQCRHISHSLFSKTWNPYSKPTQITVWLGDLNYRVQGIDSHPARNLIRKGLLRVKVYLHETNTYLLDTFFNLHKIKLIIMRSF